MENQKSEVREEFETRSLIRIAIFLEGYKLGNKGNIQPLGNFDLEQLWAAIKYLQLKNKT